MKIYPQIAALIFSVSSIFAGDTMLVEKIEEIVAEAPALSNTAGFRELVSAIKENPTVTIDGSDQANRPAFVGLQYVAERALTLLYQEGKITPLVGVIHTDAPATPLCTEGDISEGLVHPSLLNDEQRLDTVKIRVESMRQFLESGALLYALYTDHGLASRSEEQLNIFIYQPYDNLHRFHLSKIEGKLDNCYSGATYFYRDSEQVTYILSFRSFQANSPTDGAWTLWLGKLVDLPASSQCEISERWEAIHSFLLDNQIHIPLI